MPKLIPVPYKTLVQVFEKVGYKKDRQDGSHIVMIRPGSPRPLVIPAHEEVSVGVISSNLRSAKLDRDTYFALLSDCS